MLPLGRHLNMMSILFTMYQGRFPSLLPPFFTIQLQEEDLIFPTQIRRLHLAELGYQARTCGGKSVLPYVGRHDFACHERGRTGRLCRGKKTN